MIFAEESEIFIKNAEFILSKYGSAKTNYIMNFEI